MDDLVSVNGVSPSGAVGSTSSTPEGYIDMKKMSHAVAEVDDRLAKAGRDVPPETAAVRGAYHGGNASHLGLTIPVQRDLFRAGYSFSGLSPQDQLPIWDCVWHRTAFHEGRNQALFFTEKILHGQIDEKIVWATTRRWADDIQSWDISDGLSSIYVRLLAKIPHTVYPVLRKWNRSRNAWLRRQSIVSSVLFWRKRAARARCAAGVASDRDIAS